VKAIFLCIFLLHHTVSRYGLTDFDTSVVVIDCTVKLNESRITLQQKVVLKC